MKIDSITEKYLNESSQFTESERNILIKKFDKEFNSLTPTSDGQDEGNDTRWDHVMFRLKGIKSMDDTAKEYVKKVEASVKKMGYRMDVQRASEYKELWFYIEKK